MKSQAVLYRVNKLAKIMKKSMEQTTLLDESIIKIGEHNILIFADNNEEVAILFHFWHKPVSLDDAFQGVPIPKKVLIRCFPLQTLDSETIPMRIKDEVLILANSDMLDHSEIYRIGIDYSERVATLSLCDLLHNGSNLIPDKECHIMTVIF